MATKDATTRTCIDSIKADLRSTSTCCTTTVDALRGLLAIKSDVPTEKENFRSKARATSRRRAGTAAAAASVEKRSLISLAPREKYILATEVANKTLKTLSDSLKNPPAPQVGCRPSKARPPSEDAQKPRLGHTKTSSASPKPLKERSTSQTRNTPRKRELRRSSSYSLLLTTGPDPGLVATAECARTAFGYLGTAEAAKALGKESKELQYENGILVLIAKLIALGLDGQAIKEMEILKKRLDNYLVQNAEHQLLQSSISSDSKAEKEGLASLLDFAAVKSTDSAVPLIATFQIYTLRIISKLKKPRVIEAAWAHLQLNKSSSPANLIEAHASLPSREAKAARLLESLAQSILALCPSILSTEDASPLQPSPEIVLRLQQLALMVRKKCWARTQHQGNEQSEILEPFTKFVMTFTRRSHISATKQYRLIETLYTDLAGDKCAGNLSNMGSATVLARTLYSLAQAASLPDEALQWLESSDQFTDSNASPAKKAMRHVRIATVSLDAYIKGNEAIDVAGPTANALDALNGSLGGSSADLESLFIEVNTFRRSATRLLAIQPASRKEITIYPLTEKLAVSIVGASIHFSSRFVGFGLPSEADLKALQRHKARVILTWKCLKSVLDSVLACCKQTLSLPQQWQDLDQILQQCSQLLCRFKEEFEHNAFSNPEFSAFIPTAAIKLSNAYWAIYLQLRKANLGLEHLILAMQRSVSLVQSMIPSEIDASHLSMKLERLGEAQEESGNGKDARKAFKQCIESLLSPHVVQMLSDSAAHHPLHITFRYDGPLATLARVLKAHHRSVLKFGIEDSNEMAFYDGSNLPDGARGALLEWQLGFYLRTLSRNWQWNSNLDNSVISLSARLQEVYNPQTYPIRYSRLSILLLQLSQNFQQTIPPALAFAENMVATGSEDTGLLRYERHFRALWDLKTSMQQLGSPPTSTLKQCFTSWESIVAAAPSWDALAERIDNLEEWLQDLEASIQYLNARGEEYMALPVLHMRVQALDIQKASDSSDRINALCDLALQFLRVGYTGKAGIFFTRAQGLVDDHNASTVSKLRWYIGRAEYLLAIGNSEQCAKAMSTARSIAFTDQHFMDMAKPSTTLSGRIRFNTVLANACYTQSLLAAARGSYKEAAQHAKQSVTLNRRIWAALESRSHAKKNYSDGSSTLTLQSNGQGTSDLLSSLRIDKHVPIAMSVTHDALSGSEFWSLIPSLYRGLMQHSQIFAHQGLLQEAMYVAEQAEKIAASTKSPTMMIDNASWRAECWAQSGRDEKAEAILATLEPSSRKCLSLAGYHSAVARVHHCSGRYQEEISSFEVLEQLLDDLTAPSHITTLESFTPSINTLAEQISTISLHVAEPLAKSAPVTRGRKAAVKPAPRNTSKSAVATRTKTATKSTAKRAANPKRQAATPTQFTSLSISEDCRVLCGLRVSILDRKVLATILQNDLETAVRLLGEADELEVALGRELSHMWATFKTKFAQSIQQIAQDITANTLPESTIAFPAVGLKERTSPEGYIARRPVPATPTLAKGVRAKKTVKENFVNTLHDARERLIEAHGLCISNGSNHLFQQISMALGHITVLMSAVSATEMHGSLHPLYAAYMSEIPKCNSLRLMQHSIEAERVQLTRDDYLQWPDLPDFSSTLSPVSDFQKEYIDIIPDAWTALSLALNEDRDELYITRFERGASPFVLRLPLARHASREMDEEEFSFQDCKRDFDEIIELSDFSTRTAKDMSSREAREQWWTEREALDTRLHELLINMENIWLGGFKGVFSQHERQDSLLARFRKSLESILDQHLPSRSKKNQQQRPVLDTRVLELFIGLGDVTDEKVDLDEALTDLIYFVVDILQFNGERNAYDEIDFDVIIVETREALCAYHIAAQKTNSTSRHTILILDKNLHVFPWESLPCLETVSISRLPSLAALRERLIAARTSRSCETAEPGHYIDVTTGGTCILNPSGDLAHTTKVLRPQLDDLQGPWNHIANRPPTEREFESSLRDNDLVLYFGHGSGAQYIKSKSVRRLYQGKYGENEFKPGCATTLLFGCSSVHLTENGIYEPSGMLASYLTAGAPAVVGMLWDVTDKDCDRFAIKAGELWGLWSGPQEDATVTKTPAKKSSKGKGRVAQLSQETGPMKTIGKGKKVKATDYAQSHLIGSRRKGNSLDEAVRDARQVCVLRYLNGASAVMYGIPVYLEKS